MAAALFIEVMLPQVTTRQSTTGGNRTCLGATATFLFYFKMLRLHPIRKIPTKGESFAVFVAVGRHGTELVCQ